MKACVHVSASMCVFLSACVRARERDRWGWQKNGSRLTKMRFSFLHLNKSPHFFLRGLESEAARKFRVL